MSGALGAARALFVHCLFLFIQAAASELTEDQKAGKRYFIRPKIQITPTKRGNIILTWYQLLTVTGTRFY